MAADHVVFATPALHTSYILNEYSPQLSQKLSTIHAADVAVVNLVFKGKDRVTPGFGFLIPKSEQTRVLGVVFDSCALPSQDMGMDISRFIVMMKGFKGQSNSAEILDIALETTEKYLFIPRADIIESHVSDFIGCIPQYRVGHQMLLKDIERIVNSLGQISLIGASYRGVDINSIIANSSREAEKVALLH